MKDRVPLYPGRVKLTPVAGQENVYDMIRADQPMQEGTPLNKKSLLKDATAALFGLGKDAAPNDVLEILSALTQHYWKYFNITTNLDTSEELGNTIAVEWPGLKFPFYIEYADSVMQDSNGDIVLNNPKTVEILTSQDDMAALVLRGKYIKTYQNGEIVYCPANATIVVTGTTITSSPYLRKVIFKRETEYVGLVSSPDESTYPKNGDIGDIYYSYVGTVLKNSIPGAKIAIGSYVGTGTHGSSNPNSLTFEFEPKLVIISGQVPYSTDANCLGYVIFVPGMTEYAPFTSDGYYQNGTVSFKENSVSWLARVPNNATGFQLNVSGQTYYYFAIG